MVSELRNPDLVDPLHDFSVLLLLPRTFRDLKKTANSEQGDIELIKSHLKSMAIESSGKLLEQANTILNSTSELQKNQNSELPGHMPSDDKDDAIAGKAKGRPQERRPGLGRKRARFSLKPNTSQPNLIDNMKLNIDQLQDPEDFFCAYEKLEKAEKELQRQRGDMPAGSTKHNLSMTARSRRPGILGKTVGYKHRYSSVFPDSDEVLSSQEIFETDIPSQSSNTLNVKITDQHGPTEERELSSQGCKDVIQGKDSVAEAENGVNSLLDEILSTNCTDLDGDGAVTFLQERLQIKPINLDKLCLPDLDSLRKRNVTTSVEQLRRPRKALSDIDNNIKRLRSKTSTESHQVADSSMYQRTSPTPPKSPFASMSLLKKRISQMGPPISPFSFRDIDVSPVRHVSPVEGREKQDLSPDVDSDHNDANDKTTGKLNRKGLNTSGEFHSPMLVDDNTAGSNMVSEKLDMPTDDNANRFDTDMDIRLSAPDGVLEDKIECMRQETVASEQQEPHLKGSPVGNMDYSGSQLGESNSIACQHRQEDGHSQTADTLPEQNTECELQVEDMQQEKVASEQEELGIEDLPLGNMDCSGSQLDESNSIADKDQPQDGNSQTADILPEQNNETYQEPSTMSSKQQRKQKALPLNRSKRREVPHRKSLADEFNSIAVEHLPEHGNSQTVDILPEENNEAHQEPSTMSLNEQRKGKAPPHNRSKSREVSHRKSLAEAGTKWESGVRRSTRIRTRPLEYWKGERFLYGRIHQSLLTVIGLKYESPPKSKKEKPAFRVKSYVSDEYKELVEKAALH
ncbi:hypothetical protein BVC80_9063g54 [Macleaya cordata]|uniref:Centromere protein C/Mif2/cnp3 n=1 Tax=Macleaya cordata TaxID=56857 RepID=A0A200PNA1_MACCD|nr:hypothetical protein BVC80_9063g54 [Macleaya cordata]